MSKVFTLVALAGVVALLSARAGGGIMPVAEVHALATDTIIRHGFNATPCLLTAIAITESGGVDNVAAGVNPYAARLEPHIFDISTGLMQTLVSTAHWLAEDMGYTAHGVPSAKSLFDPLVSMYFGGAYVDHLSRYGRKSRSEEWIIQSYNAGPNNASRTHLAKYQRAVENLKTAGVC